MSESQQSQPCSCCSSFGLLFAALIGGLIGAGVALVLAPKPGSETLADLKARAGTAADTAAAKAKEFVAAAKQKIEEARAQAETCACEPPSEAAPEAPEA